MGYETSQRLEQLGRHGDRLRITLAGRPLGEALLRHAQVGGVHPGLWPPDAVPVRDHPRRATAAASTCSSVRSGFASGFMEALSAVAVAAATPTALLIVQRFQHSLHRHGRPLPASAPSRQTSLYSPQRGSAPALVASAGDRVSAAPTAQCVLSSG
jgi:hypothetical protein